MRTASAWCTALSRRTQKTPAADLDLARRRMKEMLAMTKTTNPHWGVTLDAFLTEDGTREAAKAEALTRVVAWQLSQEMEKQGITKAMMAEAHADEPRPGRPHPES
jgi:hypothetical protein